MGITKSLPMCGRHYEGDQRSRYTRGPSKRCEADTTHGGRQQRAECGSQPSAPRSRLRQPWPKSQPGPQSVSQEDINVKTSGRWLAVLSGITLALWAEGAKRVWAAVDTNTTTPFSTIGGNFCAGELVPIEGTSHVVGHVTGSDSGNGHAAPAGAGHPR